MFVCKTCAFLVLLNLILAKSLPRNETSVLTTYAKVANFGSSSSTVNEGRSSGMSLYTQSSHAKVISGQNLKSRMPYYAFKPSRMSPAVMGNFPARGEVQERFNPRPYFDYLHVPAKKLQTSSGSARPSPVYGTPFDSSPVFKGSDSSAGDAKPTIVDARPSNGNVFSSTFDSYIPSNGPIDSYTSPMNGNDGKQSDNSMMDSSQSKEDDNSSPTGNSNEYPGYPYAPPDDMSSEDQKMPPSKETSSEEMSDTSSHENNHDYSHYHDVGPTIVNTVRPPGPIEMPFHNHDDDRVMGNNGGGMDNGGGDVSNGEGGGMDMSSMDMPKGYPKLPEYIDHNPKEHGFHYPDFYHYDHHPVYHEITTTTTTTTEAPPEERVNNNYSYYYLGRKLWYIPLYFSAYFIIYITVLILKSIARHKVTFWQDLHNLGSRREGRNLKLEEMTKSVTDSIERAQAKYMM